MLRPRQRWIFFYRFNPTVRTERVAPPEALDLMRAVEAVFEAGDAYVLENVEGHEEKRRITLQDMEIDEDARIATLLFTIGDPELSDPIFENLKTGRLRPAGKRAEEGVSFAAHLVLSLDADAQGTYQMLLEQVPYLSKSRLIPFLKRMVRDSSYEFEEIDENGDSVRVKPTFTVDGDMSQRLQEEIEHGQLSDIILVKNTRIGHGLDEDGYFYEANRQIRLKIDRDANLPKWDILRRARELATEENMEEMRVRYVRDDEKNRTIRVSIDDQYDIQDALNVRCECIDLDYELPNSRRDIDPDLQEIMIELMS